MRFLQVAVLTVLVALPTVPCFARPSSTLTETFDGPVDEASWRMGPQDEIVALGGNPGAYLRDRAAVTAIPAIATVSVPGPFLGSYRNMGVIGMGVDIQVFGAGLAPDERPIALVLLNQGSSADPADDCEVVSLGKRAPTAGDGWRVYDFKVPAWQMSMPAGWAVRGACAGLAPDAAWNRVMSNVSQASFHVGDPDGTYAVQIWDIGFDNARMVRGKGGTGPTFAARE